MSALKISRELALPIDVAGEAIAILAKRGAGKTNTATVLVEELARRNVQTVIVDPVGAWWGIRASAQGERDAGLAIPILGGQHGDVPLEQTAGALIADVAVDTSQSLLLDLSDFPSKAAVNRFVTDFAERLYRRKGRASSLLHLVLEEADEFAPQRGQADTARMRGAIEQIVRRGRSRGLGVTLITQRSAVLNKDVLTQADVLIVMRTTGPHDVKAIREWVAAKGDEHGDTVISSLPSLATGEAWVWNPERDLLQRVQVRRRRTFDSSATPKAGETRAEPGDVAQIDLAALGERIAATAEQAKQNDAGALRKRVRDLERELAQRPTETERVEVPIEVPAVDSETLELLQSIVGEIRDVAEATNALRAVADQIDAALRSRPRAEQGERREPVRPETTQAARAPARRPAPPTAADTRVSGPQQKILDALAWFEAIGVTDPRRPPLAAVAGVSSKSSGFRANVSTLSGLGLISYPDSGRITFTPEGRQAANEPDEMPTEEALQDAICRMVSGPQAALLRELIRVWPEPLDREELAARAGVSHLSSGFRANVSTLSGFELVGYPTPGQVEALPILFPERAVA